MTEQRAEKEREAGRVKAQQNSKKRAAYWSINVLLERDRRASMTLIAIANGRKLQTQRRWTPPKAARLPYTKAYWLPISI
jgi:hypothetical protein